VPSAENQPQMRMATPGNQSWRGNRLYPSKMHDRYYTLNLLREELLASLKSIDCSQPTRVLDFGCGNMPYKPLLEQTCRSLIYSGADLDGNALADFVIRGDGHLEVPDDQFDIVVSTQVLEHVADPQLYLAEAFPSRAVAW